MGTTRVGLVTSTQVAGGICDYLPGPGERCNGSGKCTGPVTLHVLSVGVGPARTLSPSQVVLQLRVQVLFDLTGNPMGLV